VGFIRLPSPLDIPKNLRLLPLFTSRPAGIFLREINPCFAPLFNLLRFGRFSRANGFGFHNEVALLLQMLSIESIRVSIRHAQVKIVEIREAAK
jgi:hypothetical protein